MAPVHASILKKPSPSHPFTNSALIMSRIVDPKFVEIVFTSFSYAPYIVLPSINNIFTCMTFFLDSLLNFHYGLAGAYVNPRRILIIFILLVCQVTHSFHGLQPNLYMYALYLSYHFQPEVNT